MRRRFGILGGLILVVAIGLSAVAGACAPAGTPKPSDTKAVAPSAPPNAPAAARPAEAPAPVGAPAPGAPGVAREADRAPGQGGEAPAGVAQPLDRMIIRTANATLTVKEVTDSIDAITDLTRRAGGYVAGTNFRNEGERRVASLSLRIPGREYDDFMRQMRRLAIKVNEETSNSQDVTEEFSDLGAQLRNLEATEAQYLALLKKAESIEDILKVQQRLNDVRGQIERVKGRMQYLERRSDFAQVNITLIPEGAARADETKGQWDPLRTIQQAWEASLRVLERAAEVALTVVVFFWWLAPLAALAYAIASALRRHRPAPPA